jgi:hypothetical protein
VATGGSAPTGVVATDTGGKPASTGTATTPKATGGPTGTPPKGDGCDACQSAAASGNASAVASALGRCTDEGKKAACKAALQRTAAGAVKAAAMNGQCDRAKALVQAAAAAGVKGAERGLKGTSCQ